MEQRFHNHKAFTLLEIIIVVFIISLFAAAVLPSFYGVTAKDITSDARTLASVIRYLNDNSRNTQSEALMIINLGTKMVTYEIEDKETSKEIDSLYAVKLTSSEEKLSGEIKVHFSESGLNQRLKVRLYDGSLYLDVIYNPFSGRVTIEKESTGGSKEEKTV